MPIDEHGRRCLPARTHLNSATSRDVPPAPEAIDRVKERKARFEALLGFVTRHNGWIVSIPGRRDVDFQCLEGSDLPEQLAALGYQVHPDGHTERILPHAIVERFSRGADGSPELS